MAHHKIVEDEAVIVRMIYRLFLEGKSTSYIAKHLTAEGIPTPGGKERWQSSTLMSILQNEKYKGCALLQKCFTIDFLSKKRKVNEGEVPQYYVEDSHPAIVSTEVFDLTQHEIKKRQTAKGYQTCANPFSGRIICGECGGFYGSKVWHSTSKYRRTIWQCNHKFKGKDKCTTPHINEEALKQAFIELWNNDVADRDTIITGYESIILVLTDTRSLDKAKAKLVSECEVAAELIHKCIEENAHNALDQIEYNARFTALTDRYQKAKESLARLEEKLIDRTAKKVAIEIFMETLQQQTNLLTEFDEGLWNTAVESVTVYADGSMKFLFKDGRETEWKAE